MTKTNNPKKRRWIFLENKQDLRDENEKKRSESEN